MKNVKVQTLNTEVRGKLSFPGDKSLSHRAIIFGSLAEGVSSFTNVLAGEDCVCTRKAFESLGVRIESEDPTRLTIHGRGIHSLQKSKRELYLGNSGTSMRLLLGILAGQGFETTLTGDESLSNRPMRRVTDHLKIMGAKVDGRQGGNFAPLKISGGNLKAVHARLPVPSAQVKSALLLAGLYAEGTTQVSEPVKSRDHTERFMKYFGAHIREEGLNVSIQGDQPLKARSFAIAGDISSAAFFMGLAVLAKNSQIEFQDVLWNPTRNGMVSVLKRMGVEFHKITLKECGPEPVADFILRGPVPGSRALKAFQIQREELPELIDEIPMLAVLATQADGTSRIHEADELRVKETDRIQSMVSNLSKMGAKIHAEGNSLIIEGPTKLHGADVDSFKDHRTAMALIIAGLFATGETTVRDVECIQTSFPTFFDCLQTLKISCQV